MTASATMRAVTTWRALVGVDVMGGEYILDEFDGPAETGLPACRRSNRIVSCRVNYRESAPIHAATRGDCMQIVVVLGFAARTPIQWNHALRGSNPRRFAHSC